MEPQIPMVGDSGALFNLHSYFCSQYNILIFLRFQEMKIVIDSAIPFIRGRFPAEIETVFIPGDEITADIVRDADALIIRTRTRCDSSLLQDTKVKLISTATIGMDHIDTEWCESHGISVKNAPGCNAPGVAQYVFSSIFKAGFDPANDTLGIVGYGNVGSTIGDWAKKMGIKTLICDPPRTEKGFKDAEYLTLEEVIRNSDVITLHVPLTTKGDYPTFGMIGEKELDWMKPHSIIINSSRGGIVDEKVLKEKLKKGEIKAILDVWENEPHIDSELAHLTLFSTPHIAGYSEEGKKRATRMAIDAINDFFHTSISTEDLECNPGEEEITPELISSSYDPQKDTDVLLNNLSDFEQLRNRYVYRHEPLFIKHK